MIIVIYINDFLIVSEKKAVAEAKKGILKASYIEDLNPAKYFVGVPIIRDRSNRKISLI